MLPSYFLFLFFIIALIYSTIGFGGGSSYIALMILSEVPFEAIPIVALACNLIVVSGGVYHYIKKKHVEWKFVLSFTVASIPFAYLGGCISIDIDIFKIILGACLLLAGLRMLFFKKIDYTEYKTPPLFPALVLGAALGFISGLVGIGGGIFLSPILYNLKWGKPKQIASVCCIFIFVNSIAGLIGQVSKIQNFTFLENYWPLAIAVLIGGQVGSFIGTTKLKPRYLELTTALLVLFVAIRIFFTF